MFEIVVLVIVVVLSLALAYLVYKSNPKSASNQWFALFAFSIVFWSIIMYLSLAFENDLFITLFFIRLSMLAGTILAIFAFIFAYIFPGKRINLPRPIMVFFLIFGPLTMMTSMSPYMFTDIVVNGTNIEPTPGPGILMFLITAIGSVVATFIVLIYKFIKAKSLQRTQYFFMILGIFLMFVLLVTTNFITVVVWKDSSFIFLAPVYPLIYLGSTAYAIFRHRILDIRLLLIRALSYFVTILVLASLFAILLFISTSLFARISLPLWETLFFIAFSIVFAIFFQPIRRVFEARTEKLFYRNSYNTAEVLNELSNSVASTIIFSELINKVGDIFTESLKPSSFCVVLYDDKNYSSLFENVKYVLPVKIERPAVEEFIKEMFAKKTEMVFEDEVEDEAIRAKMNEFEIAVLLPLIVNQKVIGGYILGPKSSGDSYSQRDLDIMHISAPQLATGIQNALSYEEIKRFNETLQQKIDIATKELQESNVKLTDSYEKLKQLDKLKDEFVSIASHELRTPLTAIKGYLWLAINKSPAPLPEEVDKNLKIAHASSERLSHMVEDMLTISRIEGNRLKLEVTKFDLVGLIQEVYNELAIRASTKKINFNFTKQSDNAEMSGDKERIREVLINLVGNALKFTPEEGSITISQSAQDNNFIIKVQDTGPGIAKEDVSKLFQKFVKLSHSYEKTKESGTGLGLYITKQIIDLHGGSINIESEVGKGTSFIVTFPSEAHITEQK